MIARAFPLLVFALVLGLLGCRDTLVDEPLPPGAETPTPTDTTTLNEIYLKGPTELRIGETRNYRAEQVEDVTTYRWSLSGGTGAVSGVPVNALNRLYDITGVNEGPVTLTVQAFGEHGAIVGTGFKSITVLR